MKKRFCSLFWVFHFGLVIAVNIYCLLGSHPDKLNQALLSDYLGKGLYAAKLPSYLQLSGIETGSGFFAPKVGSQYGLQVLLFGRGGELLVTASTPIFHSHEGLIRYARLLDSFEALAGPADSSLKQRYARALALNLARNFAKAYTTAHCLQLQVFVFRPGPRPPLLLYEKKVPIL